MSFAILAWIFVENFQYAFSPLHLCSYIGSLSLGTDCKNGPSGFEGFLVMLQKRHFTGLILI